jgi:hypothetical protein
MSAPSGTDKRFFIKANPDLHQRLRILAIKRGTNTEIMGGAIVAAAIDKAERDEAFAPVKPAKKPRR